MTVSAHAASGRNEPARIFQTLIESPGPVKAVLLGVLVNKLGQFLQIFLVLFLTNRGFTSVQAGFALGAWGVGAVVGVVVGGTLADKLGARRATVLSMTGNAVLVLGVLYVHEYASLLVLVALVAAVGLIYRPASAALLADLTPLNRRVMVFAIYRMALNLGTAIAPLIGVALIAVSYNLLFWVDASTALAYAVLAAIALPPGVTHGHTEAERRGEQAPARGRARGGYLAVLADGRYVLFLLAFLVNSTVYVQYVSVLPLAIHAAHLRAIWYGSMVTLNGVVVISFELLMTKLTQRWRPRWVAVVGFTLLGGGMSIYSLPLGAAVLISGTLVWSLAEIIAGPTMVAYPAMTGPASLRGRYIAAGQAVFGAGTAIGPVVGTAIWRIAGSAIWWGCGLACLVGLVAAWFGIRPVNQAPEPDQDPAAGAAAEPAADGAVGGSFGPRPATAIPPEPA